MTRMAGVLLLSLLAQGASMASDPPRDRVVLIGASYAHGWDIPQIGGLTVLNEGVGGNQSHEMLARFAEDVIALEPPFVIIWGFINDVFRSSPEEIDARLARTRENYERMVTMAIEAGIRPVLATEITLARPKGFGNAMRAWLGRLRGKQSYQAWVNQHVTATNQWIREYGRSREIPVLDFEAALSGRDGWRSPSLATPDGSHVSREGYEALSAYTAAQWPALAGP